MLEELARSELRFVVIGGVAANALGSSRITHDLDICYDAAPDSLHVLAELINRWNPRLRVRGGGGPPFPLDERNLRELAAITLETDRGPIDLLREVSGVGDYAACKAESEPVELGDLRFDVLSLPALIRAKRAAGRRKDQEALLELEALADLVQEREAARLQLESLVATPVEPPTTSLAAELEIFAQVKRLEIECVRHAHEPERLREIGAALDVLPPVGELARRIVAAARNPAQLEQLSPEQLALLRAARADLAHQGPDKQPAPPPRDERAGPREGGG